MKATTLRALTHPEDAGPQTDDETVRLLEKAGVDYAQGYHVGKPQPLRDLLPS